MSIMCSTCGVDVYSAAYFRGGSTNPLCFKCYRGPSTADVTIGETRIAAT